MSKSRVQKPSVANQLRALAESADGLRDQDMILVQNADGTLQLRELPPGTEAVEGQILLHTRRRVPNRSSPSSIRVTHPTLGDFDVDTSEYDSIYWDEPAYEKFLLPYYVRFYDDAQLAKLRQAMYSEKVMALAHLKPTRWETLGISEPMLLLAPQGEGLLPQWVSLSAWDPTA